MRDRLRLWTATLSTFRCKRQLAFISNWDLAVELCMSVTCVLSKPCRAAGATCLAGGKRDGAMHDATLLENVPPECDVVKEEVFGPVVVIDHYATFKDAIAKCVAVRHHCAIVLHHGVHWAVASGQGPNVMVVFMTKPQHLRQSWSSQHRYGGQCVPCLSVGIAA